jgi:hypothetical protein
MNSEEDAAGVEVTPEMLEAGFAVLRASGIADEYLDADKLLVQSIFEAMMRARAAQGAEKQ